MSPSDKIALTSAIIAGLSLVGNFAQAFWIHRLTAASSDRESVDGVLQALQSEFIRSNLFDMDPHMEIWEYGFETLQHVSGLLAAAQVTLSRRRDVPRALHAIVHDVAARVKTLRRFRDSYTTFRHGTKMSPMEAQKQWPDWAESIRQLRELQPRVARCKEAISAYLAQQ